MVTMQNKNGLRKLCVTMLGGLVYAVLYSFGYEMEKNGTCPMPETLIKALMLFPILSAVLYGILRGFERRCADNPNARFSTLWAYICILGCYVPMFVIMYPGIFCIDVRAQLPQVAANLYNTHHPLLHTLLIKLCIDMRTILSSLNRCAALYSVLQMMLLAGCFALTAASISRSCSVRAAKWSVLFFALYPLHMIYAVTCTKDVLFSGTFVLLLAVSAEAVCHGGTWKTYACIVSSGVLSGMLRNNMLYACAAWLIILVVILRGKKARLIVGIGLSIVLTIGFNNVLKWAMNAKDGDMREALSVPVQQLARARIMAEDRFTQEEKEALDEMILKEKWREYNPGVSDSVKGAVDSWAIRDNPKKYIDLYISIGKKCPQEYLDAAVALMYPFLYPYREYRCVYDYVETEIDPQGFDRCYGEGRVRANERFAAVRNWLDGHIWKTGADRVPVLGWILNMGAIIWMMLLFVIREAYMGRWQRFAIFLLPVLLWCTFLLGPVMYSRYVYPFVCCLPVLGSRVREE